MAVRAGDAAGSALDGCELHPVSLDTDLSDRGPI
jgi:hypothetical protein